jgi:hypothetical protein
MFGAGFKQQKISFLSPLSYEGVSLVSSSGKTSFRSGKLTSSDGDVYADIFQNPHNSSMVTSVGVDYTYNKYYLIPNRDSWETSSNLFVGWGYWLDSDMAVKYDNVNNLVYYHLNNMACLTFAITGRIGSVHILEEMSFPIVGIYFGSQYGSPLPYFAHEEDASVFDAFDILFIRQSPRFQNKLSADFKPSFKWIPSTIRVQYALGMRTMHLNNNEMHNFYHQLKIGYLFNEIPYTHK